MALERPKNRPFLELRSAETYMTSSLKHLEWQLHQHFGDSDVSVEKIKEQLEHINAYENIDHLSEIKQEHITLLDESAIKTDEADRVLLDGEFFWEHAVAGEATRLGIGTKYLIKLGDLGIPRMIEMRKNEIDLDVKDKTEAEKLKAELTEENLIKQMGCRPEETLPLSLGTRHMLQMAFDLKKLAEKHGKDPETVLKKQKTLLVMNEASAQKILEEVIQYRWFGLDNKNFFFMIQKSFHGIHFDNGTPKYDMSHDKHKRLHNHGQLVMQKTHDDEIFYLDTNGARKYLKSDEFGKVLSTTKVLVSFNVEDLGYLTNSIDLYSLALSLDLGKKGHKMTMEMVAQNPLKPQKGGACFWDNKKKRPVLIESNQLKGMDVAKIKHLNKNFNHYIDPVTAFREVKAGKMHMHLDVKLSVDAHGNPKYYLYFCPPQGDINFLVSTAYIMRKNLKPLSAWKSPATTPIAVKACYSQDQQKGFKEFAERMLGEKF